MFIKFTYRIIIVIYTSQYVNNNEYTNVSFFMYDHQKIQRPVSGSYDSVMSRIRN